MDSHTLDSISGQHIHLTSCSSTQLYLKDYLKNVADHPSPYPFLISTQQQTQGIGRSQRQWTHLPQSLAFSFTYPSCSQMTLTSLKVGIILADYIKTYYHHPVFLKWPNDLYTHSGKKCGGIIIHHQPSLHQSSLMIVGVGLNTTFNPTEEGEYGILPLSLTNKHPKNFQQLEPASIYQYACQYELPEENITTEWEKRCFHLNKQVTIMDEEHSKYQSHGLFLGLGTMGEAKIQYGSTIQSIFSGGLLIQ
jgi:biotin-[acetyl-CoA-carboxylase] ligase BirA-like protein